MVRWIRVNQLNKRRKKEIKQGWDAASSPSLTTTRSLCQIAVRSMRMIAREPEYSPSRHDLTRDYQQSTISLEGKVISVYITLTPKAARNPQIISSFVRQSKSLFHDIFFSEIPSMIMLPLHKKRKLYLLSLLWFRALPKHQEGNLLTAYFP